jgi:hypothetical protein
MNLSPARTRSKDVVQGPSNADTLRFSLRIWLVFSPVWFSRFDQFPRSELESATSLSGWKRGLRKTEREREVRRRVRRCPRPTPRVRSPSLSLMSISVSNIFTRLEIAGESRLGSIYLVRDLSAISAI